MQTNNEKYLLNITGIQDVDGDKNEIEVITTGEYILKNGKRYIKYIEYDNENPNISSSNVVKVEGNSKVTIIRKGEFDSRLILEKGRRHQCHYRTMFGDLMVGVYTDTIDAKLDDEGGTINVKYQLDFNSDLMSNNEFIITIKRPEA